MSMINLTIDGVKVQVPKGTTVLEAARKVNIKIPSLCYLKGINEIGACRMCVVDVGARSLQAACVYPVFEGLEVKTNTEQVRKARRSTLELILSNHDRNCLTCVRNGNCELQKLADDLNIKEIKYNNTQEKLPLDDLSPSIVRDPNKCILCRRCVSMCKHIQQVGVIDTMERGYKTMVKPAFDKSLAEVPCVNCGQCITVCPVGAIKEKDNTDIVWKALNDPGLHVVVQTAPAVRVAIGEEFGMPIGTIATKNMIGALKKMGFDKVFDTNTAADLTIMEEGTELINRINKGGTLPLITSCSPGWIKFCEHEFPEFLDNLSSCKSPQQMFGAMIKSYYAKKMDIDPKKIFVVSVMPCTAKKFEVKRKEMINDVDVSITTRELAAMIKESGIDFSNVSDEHFDDPLGDASGAAVIFGATGGVMEAAIRTVYEILTGKALDDINIAAVRGVEGIKEASVKINDELTLKAAVAHGLKNARDLLGMIKNGEKQYHFIEIMACPGGCVTGGGQPIQPSEVLNSIDLRAQRAKAIYDEDENMAVRKSHENPAIKKLYDEFFEKPGSHKAHELLHTHYCRREKYPK